MDEQCSAETSIQEISNDVSRAVNETTISTFSATGEEKRLVWQAAYEISFQFGRKLLEALSCFSQ